MFSCRTVFTFCTVVKRQSYEILRRRFDGLMENLVQKFAVLYWLHVAVGCIRSLWTYFCQRHSHELFLAFFITWIEPIWLSGWNGFANNFVFAEISEKYVTPRWLSKPKVATKKNLPLCRRFLSFKRNV